MARRGWLRAVGTPVWKAIAVASAGGLLEPLGAVLDVTLIGSSLAAYPMGARPRVPRSG